MARKKISTRVKREIDQYIKILKAKHVPIEKIILYGSHANGTQTKWSDIDLCIVSKKFTKPMQAMQYLWSKRDAKHDIRIEPVGFHPKDFQGDTYDSLVHEIKKTALNITCEIYYSHDFLLA